MKKTEWAKLRTAMTNLDNSIPDHVFNDIEDPQELADSISDLWDAIADLQKCYGIIDIHMAKKD